MFRLFVSLEWVEENVTLGCCVLWGSGRGRGKLVLVMYCTCTWGPYRFVYTLTAGTKRIQDYNIRIINQQDAALAVLCLLTTTSMLYMFRTPFASIIRSTINCNSSQWCLSCCNLVVNKHNTARVASCWSIIYYRFVMHGISNIKYE